MPDEPWPPGIIGPLIAILNTLGDASEERMRGYLEEVIALMGASTYYPEHEMLDGIAKFLDARISELQENTDD